jgi:hypothetical protein
LRISIHARSTKGLQRIEEIWIQPRKTRKNYGSVIAIWDIYDLRGDPSSDEPVGSYEKWFRGRGNYLVLSSEDKGTREAFEKIVEKGNVILSDNKQKEKL